MTQITLRSMVNKRLSKSIGLCRTTLDDNTVSPLIILQKSFTHKNEISSSSFTHPQVASHVISNTDATDCRHFSLTQSYLMVLEDLEYNA